MQEDFRLIVDLVSVFGVAACGGLVAALLRQPVLLGYLIGGMVIGPTGLGLIKELIQVETLAQFGVAFLLFALGVFMLMLPPLPANPALPAVEEISL